MHSGLLAELAAGTSSSPQFSRPTFLMCPPEWYDVRYILNPWMAGNVHRSSRDRAFAQWRVLFDHLRRVADVRMLPAELGCPDMTFVAHAAVIQDGLAALSSFAHKQRQPEIEPLRRWLIESGFLLWETPREMAFEGEGDALFDRGGRRLWIAHGVRTSKQSHTHLSQAWHVAIEPLHLIDPRFYHLDTCFAPLPGGYLLYFPGAFDQASQHVIEREFPAERRIAVSEQEATQFACSLIAVGRHILMGQVTGDLDQRLAANGFEATQLDLSEFVKGGGSAKSLALRLSDTARSG